MMCSFRCSARRRWRWCWCWRTRASAWCMATCVCPRSTYSAAFSRGESRNTSRRWRSSARYRSSSGPSPWCPSSNTPSSSSAPTTTAKVHPMTTNLFISLPVYKTHLLLTLWPNSLAGYEPIRCWPCDDFLAGGTFALYSLLCRHAKLSLILNQQTADTEVSTYKVVEPPDTARGEQVRKLLEKHRSLRVGLLIIVLLGTCMVIGDGVLTPSISGIVPSAKNSYQFFSEFLGICGNFWNGTLVDSFLWFCVRQCCQRFRVFRWRLLICTRVSRTTHWSCWPYGMVANLLAMTLHTIL